MPLHTVRPGLDVTACPLPYIRIPPGREAALRLANTLRGWCSTVRAREQPAGECYDAGAGTSKSRSWRAKVL